MPFVLPILEALLLPPGLLVLVAIAAIVLLLFGFRRTGYTLVIAGCLLLYLFSIVPVSNFLVIPLENHYPPLSRSAASGPGIDAIVVLGGGLVPESPAAGGDPSLAPEALKRLVYGAQVAESTNLPMIVTGGIVPSRPASQPEALIAKRTVQSLGIRERSILTETKSRNTWENAVRVEERFHPKRVILVTSAFHMPRSVLAFERNAIRVIPAPTDYLSDRAALTFYSFLPTASSLRVSAVALKEYVGYLFYRLFLFHHQA